MINLSWAKTSDDSSHLQRPLERAPSKLDLARYIRSQWPSEELRSTERRNPLQGPLSDALRGQFGVLTLQTNGNFTNPEGQVLLVLQDGQICCASMLDTPLVEL